jgi:RND family efflux transporter MFP subunit
MRAQFLLFTFSVTAPFAGDRDFECMIEPHEEVKVSSEVPGILQEVLVERGDIIKKGQTLARLKSAVEAASVDLARARVRFGMRKRSRYEGLLKKKLISAHEIDELETEIQLAELELRQAVERLKRRTIYSTINGVVVKRLLLPGEYVGEEPILKTASIDPLNVEVIVPVEKIGSIKENMRAEVRPQAPVGGKYTGRVVIVDKVVDAASGTFGVRVELPNPSLKLPAGLNCRVRFLKN